jgi:hypothetical protein
MEMLGRNGLFIILLLFVSSAAGHAKVETKVETKTCPSLKSPCCFKKMKCPAECPTTYPKDPNAKACYVNCYSPICKAECKSKTIIIFHYILIYHVNKCQMHSQVHSS